MAGVGGNCEWSAEALFDVSGWTHARLFSHDGPVWEALRHLADYTASHTAGVQRPAGYDGVVFVGEVRLEGIVSIEPGVMIKGPAVLCDGAEVRQGAYLRGPVLVGERAVVGHCSELKHAILLPGAAAPHFNYVGDSILGQGVNLGAGTICSNVRLNRGTVSVQHEGGRVDTGLHKFGAVLGDGCQTGCNTVLNPGTVAGRGCLFHPLVSTGGWFPAGTVVRGQLQRAGSEGQES